MGSCSSLAALTSPLISCIRPKEDRVQFESTQPQLLTLSRTPDVKAEGRDPSSSSFAASSASLNHQPQGGWVRVRVRVRVRLRVRVRVGVRVRLRVRLRVKVRVRVRVSARVPLRRRFPPESPAPPVSATLAEKNVASGVQCRKVESSCTSIPRVSSSTSAAPLPSSCACVGLGLGLR